MNVQDIFPVPIASDTWNGVFSADELNTIFHQQYDLGTSHFVSQDHYVLDHTIFSELRLWIDSRMREYYRDVLKIDQAPYITQSWINLVEKGMCTHQHIHQNSIVSGVFYVKANDVISFHRQPSSIEVARSENNLYNSDNFDVNVRNNMLLLFPSDILHSTPISSEDMRVSIAFNTFVKGNLGDEKRLTYLEINDGSET